MATSPFLSRPGYLKAIWPYILGCVFEVRPAPGAREGPQKCGASPPAFLKAFPGPRGRPDLKNAPPKIRPDCLQVPGTGNLHQTQYREVSVDSNTATETQTLK